MFEQLNGIMDVIACVLEINIVYKKQQRMLEAPKIIIEQEFMSLVKEANSNDSPIMIRVSCKVPIWSQFQNKWIERENSIEFRNLSWQNR